MDVVEEIRSVLERKAAALVARRADLLSALIHDSFVYVNAGGRRFDKPDYVDAFCTSGRILFLAQCVLELDVRRVDAVATATMTIHDELRIEERAVAGRYRSLCVFLRSPDGWRWLAGQTAAVTEAG